MSPRVLRVLLAGLLVLAPLLGVLGVRRDGGSMYTSMVRMGPPTAATAWLMGPRAGSTETQLQEMRAMDQYWFAFEQLDAAALQRIAFELSHGEHRLGAYTVACMSARNSVTLDQARAEDVRVCVSGARDDLGVEACTDQVWRDQSGRLVLLSLVGQDARLDATELVQSCQIAARHWQEWHHRQ